MNKNLAIWLLRIGLASVFAYAAINSFLVPDNWIGFIPQFLRSIFPANLLLSGFSIFQIILTFWIISGKQSYLSSIVSAITIGAIIITNFGAMDIVFRDIAILFAALALFVLTYPNKK